MFISSQCNYKNWTIRFNFIKSIIVINFVAITMQAKDFTTKFAGQYVFDSFVAANMNTLNSHSNDFVWYTRSTIDYSFDAKWGEKDKASIVHFYDAIRFRYLWGSSTETYSFDTPLIIAGTSRNVVGPSVNKHLLWMREGWLKFDLNSLMTNRNVKFGLKSGTDNYIQLGLIPYQVGRGISLGAAYDSSGFLGFKSDFAIDQYAPAVLVNLNIVPDKYSFSIYGASLKNKQTSIEDTYEALDSKNLQAGSVCGIGRQAYIFAWDHKLHHSFCDNIDIEPYILYLEAPDQMVEFKSDTDISLLTLGVAVEGVYTRWSWGFEGAFNRGELLLKAWDRNTLSVARNEDGYLVTQYTKVYNKDPKLITAMLVQATMVDDVYVNESPKKCKMNGKQIGPNLYNAYDRFRAVQRKNFDGYFLIADATYDILPTVLQWAFGAGYASGNFDARSDTNKISERNCLNQKFSGFIPLQSEYAGKRIRHIGVFNQGLPRCDNRDSADVKETNLINDIQPVTIQDLTNIAFVGTRAIWHPAAWKSYALEVSGNIVGYWTPESVRVEGNVDKQRIARDFLGIELSTEFAWAVWEKLTFAGYVGIFLPGSFYQDNYGKILHDLTVPSGSDIGYIANFAVTYDF